MFRNHSISLSIYFLFIAIVSLNAQGQWQDIQGTPLSKSDSVFASTIPELKLPEKYKQGKAAELPWKLNNAEHPYFRPIFNQDGASCGQASGIGYNFTYEINCARDLPANDSINQYPTHFAWNFMNGGNGWRGVSYFHSFDLLKACGTPNVETYGGQMSSGGERRWMSGYDAYFSAMKNRIKDVFYIPVNTPEGLLTLKHWLVDHMDGSDYGGVASFYASVPAQMKPLPPESPDAGKLINTYWRWPATHAMTIVGYNDSIRYDWNGDGQFTNNIDITNDGVVDMKDWEFGALLMANSYGDYWGDSGFYYTMYRTLGYNYGNEGIWNGHVHVLSVNENYTPQLTMRVKIRHNSREKIKIIAGVSADTLLFTPTFTMDFPLLNFQGGDMPMQGLDASDSLDPEVMEVELDVTPLLGHVKNNEAAKYFFQVIENDPNGHGWGEVLHYSLIDRTGAVPKEVFNTETPLPIANNSFTTLALLSTTIFDKLEIGTIELPAFEDGQDYTTTIEANGGQEPYKWTLLDPYTLNAVEKDFPEMQGEKLDFYGEEHGHYTFDLAFPFPYYGESMQKVSVAIDGLLSFEDEFFAYPYYFGETTLLKDRKVIAPFMANLWIEGYSEYGVWVESTDEYFGVSWKATYNRYNVLLEGEFNFAVKLFPDGRIETYYGECKIPSYVMWVSGISNGDNTNYTLNNFAQHTQNPTGRAFEYTPAQLPDNINLSESGVLTVSQASTDVIYQITTQVEDDNHITNSKTFQLSSGLIYTFEVRSGIDNRIDFGDTTSLDLTVKNLSNNKLESIDFHSAINSDKITLFENSLSIGSLAAGQSKTIDSAIVFKVDSNIPDQYNFTISSLLSNDANEWNSHNYLTASALQLNIVDLTVINEDNGFLEPGETADVQIEIQNLGHASGENLDFEFVSNSEYLVVNTPINHVDNLEVGGKAVLSFNVSSRDWTPSGFEIIGELKLFVGDEKIRSITVPLNIGKVPVLILNLTEATASSDHFREVLDSLQLVYEFRSAFPSNLDEYNSIFICLGPKFNSYSLNWQEGNNLKNFLISGGKIYMEGMRAWLEDDPSPVHSMFNFDAVSNGNYFEFDHLYGVEGTPTEGITMLYGGSMPFNNHYLLPTGTAFTFLRTSPNDTACVVANDTAGYKTIGSSVLFGEMADSDSSFEAAAYTNALLEFFDIHIEIVGIPKVHELEEPLRIELFPNPFTDVLNMRFYSLGITSTSYEIVDLNGRLIYREKLDFNLANQSIEKIWDGSDASGQKQTPGIYFIKFNGSKQTIVRKVVLQ